jgi:hypothetical protein
MAKRRNESGCGLAVLALAIIFVLGKCAGDADDPTKPSPVLHAELPEPPTATMYVSSANLNCRATPSSSADIVAKLSLADQVTVGEVKRGWAEAQRPEGSCWVAQRFLSEDQPEMVEQAPQPQPEPVSAPMLARAVEAVSAPHRAAAQCGTKWKCGQMDSCEEAYHYLNDCGVGRLDGDGDGVPCESIC